MANEPFKRSIPIRIAVLMLLFASVSFALFEPDCRESGFALSLRNSNWMYIAMIAIAAAYALTSFAYMLSKFFSQEQLSAWARNEFYQITGTVIIIFLIFGLVSVESKIFEAFGFDTKIDFNPSITAGKTYLQHVWLFSIDNMANLYLAHTSVQVAFSYIGNFMPKDSPVSLSVAGFSFAPGFSINGVKLGNKFGSLARNIFTLVVIPSETATAISTAQIWFLCIVNATAFTLLLPIGLFLRAVPLLRGVGSAFIAIAIGFYLVYPLTLMLNETVVKFVSEKGEEWWSVGPFVGTGLPTVAVGVSAASYLTYEIFDALGFGSVKLVKFLAWTGGIGALGTSVSTLMSRFIENATFSGIILGLFLPFIDVVITFSFTRELSKLLGSEINLSQILRIL